MTPVFPGVLRPVFGNAGGVSIREAVDTLYTRGELLPRASIETQSLRIIGQFNQLYALVEAGDELWIVDQHAAEERVLYEDFTARAAHAPPASQKLLIPFHWEISAENYTLVEPLCEELKQIGLVIEPFGQHSLVVREIPLSLNDVKDTQTFLQHLIEKLSDDMPADSDTTDVRKERLIRAACRAAVKSRDFLAAPQMAKLLERLQKCSQPYTCPHGRPTLVRLSRAEIDRKFER
jgi:DNA mismatch repair protein MutL